MTRTLAAPVLTLGWATAVATWITWYVLYLPAIQAPPLGVGIAVLLVLLLGAAHAGSRVPPARAWLAGGGTGAITASLGLVILLSYLVEQPAPESGGGGGLTLSRLLWGLGFVLLATAAGALAGTIGGLLARIVAREGTPGSAQDGEAWLSRFALVTAAAFLPLIVAGGTVTSTGAGLAVEGWPDSEGMAMVLYPIELMSTPRVYFEHSHRLLGLLVGITTIALLAQVWSARGIGRAPRVLTAILLGLVVVQGVMGGMRVTEQSMPLAVVHAVLAQLVFGLACAIAALLSPSYRSAAGAPAPATRRLRRFATGATHALAVQLLLGALYRHMTAHDPESGGANHVLYTHAAFSIVVVIFVAVAGFMLRSVGSEVESLRRPLTSLGTALVAILAIQFVLGWAALIAIMLTGGKSPVASPEEAATLPTPPLAQTLLTTAHQANGALLIGCTAAAFVWARRLSRSARA